MVRLYAHRGAAAELPENTIPSFRRALEVGADALEMDVHLTRDWKVVVSHDATGERMAGVDAEIRHCDLAEIKTWDAGIGFVDEDGERPYADQGFEIPTLAEVLEAFPDVVINIDLKQHHPSMVDATLEVIHRHGAEERVQIASFDLPTLLLVRKRRYPGVTAMAPLEVALALFGPAVLVRRAPFRSCSAQIPTRAEFLRQSIDDMGLTLGSAVPLHLVPGADRLSRIPRRVFPTNAWMVRRLHKRGVPVEFWTVNDPGEAQALAALGVEGIMTDDPLRVARALGKAPAATANG